MHLHSTALDQVHSCKRVRGRLPFLQRLGCKKKKEKKGKEDRREQNFRDLEFLEARFGEEEEDIQGGVRK